LPTQYKITKEEMGHITVDRDKEWTIPLTETGPPKKKNLKIHKVDEDEEEGYDQGKGKGPKETTQLTTPRNDGKRK